jgi:subtilisin family serine protease
MAWYEELEQPKAADEAAIIVDAFAALNPPVSILGEPTPTGWISYMYAEGHLLAREQYVQDILQVLGNRGRATVTKRVIKDIVLLELAPLPGDLPLPMMPTLLGEIDAAHGPGIATLDHVLTASNGTGGQPSGCPATEAQEVYDPRPYPAICPGHAGDGVRIYVADTGIVDSTVTGPGARPWLAGVTGDPDPSVAGGTIQPYGGHGTFVAGVIRAMAPGSEIVVRSVFNTAGSSLESDFVPKLSEGFGYDPDIFHITVASPTKDNQPLIAFQAWLEDLRQHKGVACVVPAGNNASSLPCWPAAFPGIISVGALATDWRSRAYFTDFGRWVDVYAPGQNLVNAFATGTYTCKVAPFKGEVRTFTAMAQWSGTSFSTPIVTGLIAARMTERGESAQQAAETLLARARARAIPGVGPVLFPRCGDDDRGCRCGCGCGCSGRLPEGQPSTPVRCRPRAAAAS